jgi:hypothetical protein
MLKLAKLFQKSLLVSASLILIAGYPLQALAEDAPAADSSSQQGPNAPQGPDADTYTYNADTGMWENAYYIWNPATGQTTPKTPQTYSYNPTTSHWDTTDWIYDPASGQYVPNTVTVNQPPAGAATVGGPAANTEGPNSPASSDTNSSGLFDNFYNASISNSITARALSGNANVTLNTRGGSATSGNAMDLANIINLLQSTTNLQGNLATFSIDIPDNVQGDITIDPAQLPSASGIANNPVDSSDVTINSQATGQINNDIDLGAKSGDAAVSTNTTGGNATTGSAQTIANIMNVINSIIASGQSFVGNINIKGNFDGDILLPPNVLDSLLAANTQGPNSPVNASNSSNNFNATLTDNTGIANTLNLSAASGDASVTNNTTAGNAKTGSATTNVTLLNLTGRQVVGKDALLVFVNVMGSWVGMIVNAPAGSTSAALGGGISTSGPNSPVNASTNNNTDINASTNNGINNNVKLNSQSGNATVSDNTTAGDATSGDAMAGVNLLNITNSAFSLSDWFGILFINVFGSWNGSFGINTAAGNPTTASQASSTPQTLSQSVKAVKVFSFVPSGSGSNNFNVVQLASANNPSTTGGSSNTTGIPLASVDKNGPSGGQTNRSGSLFWTAGSLFFLAGVLSSTEAYARRKETRQKIRDHIRSITVPPLKQP